MCRVGAVSRRLPARFLSPNHHVTSSTVIIKAENRPDSR
jgi:hypothetical protein